jgi:putative spermidine/putrescine transport system permease protein
MKKNHLWSWFWIFLGTLYFVVPLIATLDFSLKAVKNQVTVVAYTNIFADSKFWETFGFSVMLGIITILVSLALVVPTVYWPPAAARDH